MDDIKIHFISPFLIFLSLILVFLFFKNKIKMNGWMNLKKGCIFISSNQFSWMFLLKSARNKVNCRLYCINQSRNFTKRGHMISTLEWQRFGLCFHVFVVIVFPIKLFRKRYSYRMNFIWKMIFFFILMRCSIAQIFSIRNVVSENHQIFDWDKLKCYVQCQENRNQRTQNTNRVFYSNWCIRMIFQC